jgi:hypothetical protein
LFKGYDQIVPPNAPLFVGEPLETALEKSVANKNKILSPFSIQAFVKGKLFHFCANIILLFYISCHHLYIQLNLKAIRARGLRKNFKRIKILYIVFKN